MTSSPFHVSPDVVFRDIEGESVLLDLASGTYFGLNEVGTRIWQLLVEGLGIDGVADALAEEYDVSRDEAAREAARLVDELLTRGLIVRSAPAP